MSNVTAAFIAKHHPKVKELMLTRQKEQTGKMDWSVFERDLAMDIEGGGFDWEETPERLDRWLKAFVDGNFDPLYALHPEWSEPKQEEPKPLIDGEWYWVKVHKYAKWEAGLCTGNKEIETLHENYALEELHAIHPEPIKKPI